MFFNISHDNLVNDYIILIGPICISRDMVGGFLVIPPTGRPRPTPLSDSRHPNISDISIIIIFIIIKPANLEGS